MLWEAHWLVVQHSNAAYATHSGSYSTECKKEIHYTLVHTWYTTIIIITAVHNIHSGAQHIHDTETFVLPEGPVAFNHVNFV